jgi:hypothetical protein
MEQIILARVVLEFREKVVERSREEAVVRPTE